MLTTSVSSGLLHIIAHWRPQIDMHELTQGHRQGQTPPYGELATTVSV